MSLIFLPDFPKPGANGDASLDPSRTLVIFDERLARVSPKFKAWLRRFPFQYGVKSGERLKELESFPDHVARLSKIAEPLSPKTMTVAAVGGGSVGDFAGFFASVYKRGVDLVHMPSTWLAAIDSSHGGKTALNNGRVKNQIGTFYPATRVFLVRSLLLSQPEERVLDAMGELGKIAVIDGGSWVAQLERSDAVGEELLWNFLKPAIQAKLKIVAKDPQEKSGVRQILNLGHTVGHVFEAHYGWSHGRAVAQGLFFAIEMSLSEQKIRPAEAGRALQLLTEKLGLAREIPATKIPTREFLRYLLQDKKKSSANEVTFIVPKRVGKVERVPMKADKIVDEARRQGWVRS